MTADKKKKKSEKPLRDPLVAQTIREVEGAESEYQRGTKKEFHKKLTTREEELFEKERVREFRSKFLKDPSMKQRLRSEKQIGGVRGKFHPSKKGTSKTISHRRMKRESQNHE